MQTTSISGALLAAIGVSLLVVGGITSVFLRKRKLNAMDIARGWRVGHVGRDQMYYEELVSGQWERIIIDGGLLMGRAHHAIFLRNSQEWKNYPEWARLRRGEIIMRIQTEFKQPDYVYYNAS